MQVLVVINPFGGHATGERIADRQEIASILGGEHARDVVLSDHVDAHQADPQEPEDHTSQEA